MTPEFYSADIHDQGGPMNMQILCPYKMMNAQKKRARTEEEINLLKRTPNVPM